MSQIKIMSHPNAGGIPNLETDAAPGLLSKKETELLRTLGMTVAEIAALPEQESLRQEWYRHNSLKKGKPLLMAFPEDAWFEILPVESLEIKDPYWKKWEWYLKHLIYRHQRLKDDFPIEGELNVPMVFHDSGWGLEPKYTRTDNKGSYIWEAPIKELDDIAKLRYPVIEMDKEMTQNRFERVSEVFSGVMPVKLTGITQPGISLNQEATDLRGMEQVMVDLYDNPEWLHELMKFLAEGVKRKMDYWESNGYLSLNNGGTYLGSGGLGYCKELPAGDFDGKNVRLKDMWGFGVAQEFSEVSPQHTEEFVFQYQLDILKRFGLVGYGCCEPYTRKFGMLKKLPNLRRVSVSPWCDVEVAADELKDRYIYSWKPSPSMLVGHFDTDAIRRDIRHTLDIAKDCVLEIILKDTMTVENKPERIEKWLQIAREEIG